MSDSGNGRTAQPAQTQEPVPYGNEAPMREAQALIARSRLMRELTKTGVRRDLTGAPPEPALVAEMRCQLVSGVDAPPGSAKATFPIPPGVRIETFHASPWLADRLKDTDCYAVPRTAKEFAGLFGQRTGISAEAYEMDRNFQVTPLQLGRVYEEIAGEGEQPSLAGLLLLSRHFEEAADAAPVLATRHPLLEFRRPPSDGFRLLTEIERVTLVTAGMSGLNHGLKVADLRRWLDAKTGTPLRKALARHPQLRRLLEYQQLVVASSCGVAPDVDIAASSAPAGAAARAAFRFAFPDPPAGSRQNSLQGGEPAAFYGLSWSLVPAMVADLGQEFQHGDERNDQASRHERQAALTRLIMRHADEGGLARADQRFGTARQDRERTGVNPQRDADAHRQITLPSPGILGSAPRADAMLWSGRWSDGSLADHRWRDSSLWQGLLALDLSGVELDLRADERKRLTKGLDALRTMLGGPPAAIIAASNDALQDDLVHAACDLATAVGPVSTDGRIGAAIEAWLRLRQLKKLRSGKLRGHGARNLPGLATILRVRKRKGVPSAAGPRIKSAPRKKRHAAAGKQALASVTNATTALVETQPGPHGSREDEQPTIDAAQPHGGEKETN